MDGADVDAAVAALQLAEGAYDDADYGTAISRADSLYSDWRDDPSLASLADRALLLSARANTESGLLGEAGERYGELLARTDDPALRQRSVRPYAEILSRTGSPAAAVEIALRHPGALDEEGLTGLRQWAAGLDLEELRPMEEEHAPTSVEARIVHVQLAQLLAAGGSLAEAQRLALGVLESGATGPERSTAELLSSLEDGASMTTARIGAILPLTGDLAGVGTLLREGIEVAIAEYERARPGGFQIDLVVRDDASDPERAAALVRELEDEGVVGIVGPLRSESFASAARARRNPHVPILSPTATEIFGPADNAYALVDREQREADAADALARWTVENLGLRRAAVLRPTEPALARAATVFARAFEAAGGRVVGTVAYDPTNSTTFREPIEALATQVPDVVFVPAGSAPDVLTVAPQLVYYGLDRSIVLGNEVWADPAVLRRLERFAADYRLVALAVDRVSPGTPWQAFVTEYERTYRKSLRDNMVPGLAHDATLLLLRALDAAGLPIAAAVSARLAGGLDVVGVTGVLEPDPGSSRVRRRTEIRMILDGALLPPDRDGLLEWLEEARTAPPQESDPFEAGRERSRAGPARR